MNYQLTVNTNLDGQKTVEYWVDKISEYYNLGSSYYSTLSVLFDAVLNHCITFAETIEIQLTADLNGLSFHISFLKYRTTPAIEPTQSSGLNQLMEQLCSSYKIGDHFIAFRLASECMPQDQVKSRQQQLTSYLNNSVTSVRDYDNFSRA